MGVTSSTKVVTTIPVEPDVIGTGIREGGVSQQQLGGVAAVKGGVALDRPYLNWGPIGVVRVGWYPTRLPLYL